jgi:predicted nucleic acid-binding protein
MIVLDTDAISELLRPRPSPALIERLREVPAHEQSTTAVTIGELAHGAAKVGRPELYRRAATLLAGSLVHPFDHVAAERYGEVRAALERAGTRLADPDLRIAAIVLTRDSVLVTGNLRHFGRVPGLAAEDWIRGQ